MNVLEVHLEIDYDTCPLCMDHIEDNNSKVLGCQHNFCLSCIDGWLKEHCVCPLCDYNVNGQIEIVKDKFNPPIGPIGVGPCPIGPPGPPGPVNPNYSYVNTDYDLPSDIVVVNTSLNVLMIMSGMAGLSYSI